MKQIGIQNTLLKYFLITGAITTSFVTLNSSSSSYLHKHKAADYCLTTSDSKRKSKLENLKTHKKIIFQSARANATMLSITSTMTAGSLAGVLVCRLSVLPVALFGLFVSGSLSANLSKLIINSARRNSELSRKIKELESELNIKK